MQILTVHSLDGVSDDLREPICEAMKSCTVTQRLAVCLFLMSDLTDEEHGLPEIERNLRKIFPPSRRHRTPDAYKNFQAVIRHSFNAENRSTPNPVDRLWTKVGHAHWRNTPLGNTTAAEILETKGILVQRQNREEAAPLHAATRPASAEALLEQEQSIAATGPARAADGNSGEPAHNAAVNVAVRTERLAPHPASAQPWRPKAVQGFAFAVFVVVAALWPAAARAMRWSSRA